MVQGRRIDAIQLGVTSPVDAVKLYTNYTKHSNVTLTSNELGATLSGFKFTQGFSQIPYGINPFTNGNCDGLLGQIGKYEQNPETGELESPHRTFTMIG